MPLGNGAVFAGYTIEGLLGSSATGDVYVARHPRLPRLDALKVLPASLTGDADFRQGFDRDADLAATLRHPNIVALHDRGEFDGRLWIAMDYAQGTDAGRLLRERHPYGMAARDVLEIVTAVADALDHGHRRGIVHRDVKPGKILLTQSDSEPRRILLADFGIARYTDAISGSTSTGAAGLASYAAPEQLMGGPLDGRADQYALAATAFHLLTGVAPYADTGPAAVVANHLNAPAPLLAHRRPDLAPLDPVLSKAMSKDPAQRFSRCVDFARALSESINAAGVQWNPTTTPWPAGPQAMGAPPILTAGPWPAMPPMPPYPGPAPRRRVLAAVLVPLVLTVVLLGAGAFTGTQVLRPRPQPSTAAPQWQPYVDYAKQFAGWLSSLSPQSADSDIQRLLDGSIGEFHDDFAKSRNDFLKTVVDSNVSTQGSVNAAALESISGTKAQVLVAATSNVTNKAGATQDPRKWRLELRVEQVGATYKVSKVEFVS
ncbi:protein kinase [Mycobacterium mantenii]|uniref:non-specific serine/threonine protein kinase n=1 Tax=Mycobacterium mantenii TaxID=560555 RepID=A0A1X0FGX6_MYCNT|nr:serine/threonine-protein kinase [Mycobacterium mantenii]MCV7244791.1 serine/threonine protein kinase [Mycobacterium mantenii]ORB00925.1 protein kinase [Mycobacterium mantenii]BBY41054.1 protein kinase [Mycobacterium mantenii]